MASAVFYLGRTKPQLILCDRYGVPTGGVTTPITYLLREGAASESPDDLAAWGERAYGALRADRRLKKKKNGVILFNAVLCGQVVSVTPVYVRHPQCPRSTFGLSYLCRTWVSLFVPPDADDAVIGYYWQGGDLCLDEGPVARGELAALFARASALPTFADVLSVVATP